MIHQYRDPYRDGKCIECGGKNPKPKSGQCRTEWHGWNIIGERAERQRRNFIRRNGSK